MRAAEPLRDEAVERLPDCFGGWAAEHLLGGGIEDHNALLVVDGDDGIHRRGDHARELCLTLAQRFLRLLVVGDVNTHADDPLDIPIQPRQGARAPGDQPAPAISGQPVVLKPAAGVPGPEVTKHGFDLFDFFGGEEGVPEESPAHFAGGVTGRLLTAPIESDNPALAVNDEDQRPGRVHDRRDQAAFQPRL